MLFLVMRSDAEGFLPADHIDPEYAAGLRQAIAEDVEILAYSTLITPDGINFGSGIEIFL